MANESSGWSVLWKNEDWLAVWIGFLIIILSLVGMKVVVPQFKWVTEGEFASFSAEMAPQMDRLASQAGAKGETALQAEALALKAALEKKDRKTVSDANKKFEGAIKDVKDKDLKKKAGGMAKEAKGTSGNVLGKVFTPKTSNGASISASAYSSSV